MDVERDGNLVLRPIEEGDYDKGYCKTLGQLTTVGDVTREQFRNRIGEFKARPSTYYIFVIEDEEKREIIASGTLVIELKVIHDCGKTGHIEDIVVNTTYRGRKLGFRIVDKLIRVGKAEGCYKIILDCSEKNVAFYNRLGFKRKEIQMVIYTDQHKQAKL